MDTTPHSRPTPVKQVSFNLDGKRTYVSPKWKDPVLSPNGNQPVTMETYSPHNDSYKSRTMSLPIRRTAMKNNDQSTTLDYNSNCSSNKRYDYPTFDRQPVVKQKSPTLRPIKTRGVSSRGPVAVSYRVPRSVSVEETEDADYDLLRPVDRSVSLDARQNGGKTVFTTSPNGTDVLCNVAQTEIQSYDTPPRFRNVNSVVNTDYMFVDGNLTSGYQTSPVSSTNSPNSRSISSQSFVDSGEPPVSMIIGYESHHFEPASSGYQASDAAKSCTLPGVHRQRSAGDVYPSHVTSATLPRDFSRAFSNLTNENRFELVNNNYSHVAPKRSVSVQSTGRYCVDDVINPVHHLKTVDTNAHNNNVQNTQSTQATQNTLSVHGTHRTQATQGIQSIHGTTYSTQSTQSTQLNDSGVQTSVADTDSGCGFDMYEDIGQDYSLCGLCHPAHKDALLADLQSTTTHIQNFQERESREAREDQSREGTPPPLPPHPTEYERSPVKPQYSTTVVTKVTSNNYSPARTLPPPQQHASYPPSNGHEGHVTPLRNNLEELDTLLQDLSSSQFIAEVDRRHSGVQSRKSGDLQTVGRANDLETSLPPPRHDDLAMNHYESVNFQHSPSPFQHSPAPHPGNHPSNYPSNYPGNHLSNQSGVPGNKPASTATRELDDLMASLSEFKQAPPQHVGEPPYAQPHKATVVREEMVHSAHRHPAPQQSPGGGNNLDAMLGNLNTDMSAQGVKIVPKGNCAACNNPIVGQVITALGRIWHPEHFVCSHCQEELGTRNFFEHEGTPYCERDYHVLFSPRCAACNGPIIDKCMSALDENFHPECFRCAHCGVVFGEDGGFHEKDGKAFCREDYFVMFAPKCGGCERPIMDHYISALSKQWHTACFVCRECGSPFGATSFFEHEGYPYCETHYHARRGSLCAGCKKPITGRCITAMYKKFHPEHFVCAFCLKQLNKGTFKEQNEKPYCHHCFEKLFG